MSLQPRQSDLVLQLGGGKPVLEANQNTHKDRHGLAKMLLRHLEVRSVHSNRGAG